MMSPSFRPLEPRHLRRLGRFPRRRALHMVEIELAQLVPPAGDGTIHDYATTFIFSVVRWRPWRWRNLKAAFTGSAALYRMNLYKLVDPDSLGRLVQDAHKGRISPGAMSVMLERLARRANRCPS